MTPDGTSYLLQEIAKLKAEKTQLAQRLRFQKARADLWRFRVIEQRTHVSLICGCGRTVRGRVRKLRA